MRWMELEPIIQSEVSQKDKDWYSILTHIYGILKDGNDNPICKAEKETQMYRTDFWTLWEKARVGYSVRIALKQVYYQGWNRSPAQAGCMRQVLGAGALGRPRGMGWGGRREGGSGWGTNVNPWLIHVNVWQKPLQYCKVISLQLIKINGKKIFNLKWTCTTSVLSKLYENWRESLASYIWQKFRQVIKELTHLRWEGGRQF